MVQDPVKTLEEDRPISPAEAEIVVWLLAHASVAGPLAHLEPTVPALRVVGRCSCGCPSIDFVRGRVASGLLADATGRSANGVEMGVILWGQPGAITGLELYELGRPVRSLPEVSSLRPWSAAE